MDRTSVSRAGAVSIPTSDTSDSSVTMYCTMSSLKRLLAGSDDRPVFIAASRFPISRRGRLPGVHASGSSLCECLCEASVKGPNELTGKLLVCYRLGHCNQIFFAASIRNSSRCSRFVPSQATERVMQELMDWEPHNVGLVLQSEVFKRSDSSLKGVC